MGNSLSTISFSPTSVQGEQPLTGTVHLTAATGSNGATVTLALNDPTDPCAIPASVHVPAGQTSATFAIQTKVVKATRIETIWGNCSVTEHASFTMTVGAPAPPPPTPVCATPTFSPAGETSSTALSVAMACSTPSATIHYTTDGTTPTTSSTVYVLSISVGVSMTIKAIATASGDTNSAVASASYTITVAPPPPTPTCTTPVSSLAAGVYIGAQTFSLSCSSGAIIHYTTDGSTPTSTSAAYTTALSIPVTTTVKAIAVAPGYLNSSVMSSTYTITTVASTPTFEDDFSTGVLASCWIQSNWGAPGGGQFKPAMLDMSQGCLCLKVTQDGTTAGSVGGEVQLNKLFGYGTYEFTMRASSTSPTKSGVGKAVSGQISGTWNFLPNSAYASVTEIDAPEVEGDKPNQLSYTVWKDGARSDYHAVPFANPEAAFHRYKYIWSAGKVQFFADDVLVATTTNNVVTQPAYPMINHWGTNSTNWGGVATAGVERYMYVSSFKFWAA